jgi:ribonucleoside-diphosphate reductase alpha chain
MNDTIKQQCLDYFQGDELASSVFLEKYALRDPKTDEVLEPTPDFMHRRISKELARIEKNKFKGTKEEDFDEKRKEDNLYGYNLNVAYDEDFIYNLLKNFGPIIPQGSVMYGTGNPKYVSLSNCFVTSVGDSYGSILRADEHLVHIGKRRGGNGLDISAIRPEGVTVQNSSRTATGILPFMERFSNTTRECGQCIFSDSLVVTNNGLKKIKNVIPNKDSVWTLKGWVKVKDKIKSGKKEVYQLTTNKGYSCITSKDHIFVNSRKEEIKLQSIEEGDELILLPGSEYDCPYLKLDKVNTISKQPDSINNLNEIELPEVLDEDLAYMLGYSYGDGHFSYDYNKKSSLFLSSNDEIITKKLTSIILDKFNYEAKNNQGSGAVRLVAIHSLKLCEWLVKNNLDKEKSGEIKVPEKIFNSNSKVQLAFFAGYFDADGCAHKTGKNVRVTSICCEFIKDMQRILLANGIISNIQVGDRLIQNEKLEYRLNITGTVSQNLLREKCIYSFKIQKMERGSLEDHTLTHLSYDDFRHIKNIRKNYSFVPSYSGRKLGISVINRLKKVGHYKEELSFVDTVRDILYIGEEETYDLVLESEHLFWCEGLLVHNSGRRSALMLSISVHHPQVLDFTQIKMDGTKVTGANVSVRITDEFMKAVEENTDYEQRWPVEGETPVIRKMVNARQVWMEIIRCAWLRAEPGILFWDTIIRESPADCYADVGFKTIGLNPCGEIPLCYLDSCRLLVVNLFCCVVKPFEKDAYFDFELLKKYAYIAQRLMDDIVDLEEEAVKRIISKINSDPESDKIKATELDLWETVLDKCVKGRRTGTGITALGDAFASTYVKYGSKESIKMAEEIYKTLKLGAYRSSVDMAKELGAFPIWDKSKEVNNPFLHRIFVDDPELYWDMQEYGRRNIALLTTAPTGTVSICAGPDPYFGTTSGIEPLFTDIPYTRRKKLNHADKDVTPDFIDQNGDKWVNYDVFHSKIKMWMQITGETDYKKSPYHKATANDLDWKQRVKLQGAITRNLDHSVSSTLNLPENVTAEQVAEIYEAAYKYNCKGLTVYRDKCRSGVLVQKEETKKPDGIIQKTDAPKRPVELEADIHRFRIDNKYHGIILVGLLNGEPYEVFTAVDDGVCPSFASVVTAGEKAIIHKERRGQYTLKYGEFKTFENIGSCLTGEQTAISRLISAALRHGTPISVLVHQLEKIKSESIQSYVKGLARILKKYIKDGTKVTGEKCTKCESEDLIRQESCITCKQCGNSKCS